MIELIKATAAELKPGMDVVEGTVEPEEWEDADWNEVLDVIPRGNGTRTIVRAFYNGERYADVIENETVFTILRA